MAREVSFQPRFERMEISMETTLAIVVLIIVIALLGALVYFYVRASGPGALRDWFVAPAALRQTFGNLVATGDRTSPRSPQDSVDAADTTPITTGQESQGAVTMAWDETALATLRDDFERDLHQTRERQGEIDSRLQRVDMALSEIRTVPDDLTNMVRRRDRRTKRQLDQLRHELEGVRRGATAAGARRDEAYADLYSHLARVEASLSTVINPMLLPGEPLQVPDEFVADTLEWENWDDVGEHAYAFGMSFNQSRLVLEPELAHEIERFIATLRQALTGKVYPTVRRSEPTRAQLAAMRTGLESIVDALTPVRRHLEMAWYEMDRPTLPPEDAEPDADEDDEDQHVSTSM